MFTQNTKESLIFSTILNKTNVKNLFLNNGFCIFSLHKKIHLPCRNPPVARKVVSFCPTPRNRSKTWRACVKWQQFKLQLAIIGSFGVGIVGLTANNPAFAQTTVPNWSEAEFRLHEDNSILRQTESLSDPELGILRIEELDIIPTEVEQSPTVYLIGQINYFQSDNILLSARDPINDGLFRVGASVLAIPELSDRTSLFASVGGSLARYSELANFDYNQITVNTGIQQRLFANTYGIVGWSHQQLFTKRGSNRFLNEHSLYGGINRRDILSSRAVLDTFYQSRISFADPDERSQFINTAGISLGYTPSSQFQAFLDYQFLYADFTRQSRYDLYHQVTGRLVYRPSPNMRIELFSGQSFGYSSNENINFDGFVFGVNLGFNVPLF